MQAYLRCDVEMYPQPEGSGSASTVHKYFDFILLSNCCYETLDCISEALKHLVTTFSNFITTIDRVMAKGYVAYFCTNFTAGKSFPNRCSSITYTSCNQKGQISFFAGSKRLLADLQPMCCSRLGAHLDNLH